MKRYIAWMLVAAALVLAGCNGNTEDPAPKPEQTTARVEEPAPFPEEQVPPPEPQPATDRPAEPARPGPPVDTSAGSGTAASPMPKDNYPPARSSTPNIYIVKKGDTLFNIAKRVYNDGRKWRTIYEANRGVLKKGYDHLEPGMELKIP